MLVGLSWAFVVGADRLRAAQSNLLERLGTRIGTEAGREALVMEVMGLAPILAEPARDADVWKLRLEKINRASRALARHLEELAPEDRRLLRLESAGAGAGRWAKAFGDPGDLDKFLADLRALATITGNALKSVEPPKTGRPTNDRARGIAHLLAGAYRQHIGALPSAADQSPFVRFLAVALDALGEAPESARSATRATLKDLKAQTR